MCSANSDIPRPGVNSRALTRPSVAPRTKVQLKALRLAAVCARMGHDATEETHATPSDPEKPHQLVSIYCINLFCTRILYIAS